jgi:hypothetical protein
MQGKHAILEGGQELTSVTQKDFESGTLMQRIIAAVNSLSLNLGAASVGKLTPPPPIQSVVVQGAQNNTTNTVTAPSEILHWAINHTQSVQKHVRYFSEIDTNSNFPNPHVIDHGTSRSGFLTLPAQDNEGNTQSYYLRSYPQYSGSDPQKPTVFGGLTQPLKIQMTGTSKTTLLPSTGSGTAAANGSQGGQGLGTNLVRPEPGPKRNIL